MPLNQDPGSAGLGSMTMAEPKMEKCSSPVMEALKKKGLHKNYTLKDHRNANDPEKHELFVRGGKPVVLPSDKPVKDVTAIKDGSGGEIKDNAPKKLGKAGMSMVAPSMPKAPMAAKPSMTNKGGTPDGAGMTKASSDKTVVEKKPAMPKEDSSVLKPLKPEGPSGHAFGSPKEVLGKLKAALGARKSAPELAKKHIGFKALENKVEHEGYSKDSAAKISASIGRKKYGAHKMAEAAHEGKPANKVKKSVVELAKAELIKVSPPGFSEDTMHKLKREHGVESAFKIAWSAYNKTHGKKPKTPKAPKSKKVKKDSPSMEGFQSLVPNKPKPSPDLTGVNKELKGFKSLVKPGK